MKKLLNLIPKSKKIYWPEGCIKNIDFKKLDITGTASQVLALYTALPQILYKNYNSHKQI
jgi:hypothetical protein